MYFPVCCLCVASGAVARVVNSPRPQGERERLRRMEGSGLAGTGQILQGMKAVGTE